MTEREKDFAGLEDASTTGSNQPKLWGGRFRAQNSLLMDALNKSIAIDARLSEVDLQGSIAYAQSLHHSGFLNKSEVNSICGGLQNIAQEWKRNEFVLKPFDEDVHTANERRLIELIGPVGGKLHTGRSRNDQAVTDVRMWLRNELITIKNHLIGLLEVFCNLAESNLHVIFPGYTHLQRAQPVRFSHFLMSHASAIKRDYDRLNHIEAEVNVLPLGSGAIAGHPLGLDRKRLADSLNFSQVSMNSMDAVSDRDFVFQFLSWASLSGIHLSRLAEDLILYSTKEFHFISLSDEYSTGSSLMPQKRNPDVLELLRGKSGRLIGNATGFMAVLKGLPSSYNKDLQEDKEFLFDSVDQIKLMVPAAAGLLETMTINPQACRAALSMDMLATDAAYYLVRRGVPFREAHHITGRMVQLAEDHGCQLNELALDDLKNLDRRFDEDIVHVWDFESSVEQYTATGGTAKAAVMEQIESLRKIAKAATATV